MWSEIINNWIDYVFLPTWLIFEIMEDLLGESTLRLRINLAEVRSVNIRVRIYWSFSFCEFCLFSYRSFVRNLPSNGCMHIIHLIIDWYSHIYWFLFSLSSGLWKELQLGATTSVSVRFLLPPQKHFLISRKVLQILVRSFTIQHND